MASDVIFLEYVDGSGTNISVSTQFVDTDFIADSNTTIEADIQSLVSGIACVFGARDEVSASDPTSFTLFVINSTQYRADRFGTSKSVTSTPLLRHTLRVGPDGFFIDDVSQATFPSTTSETNRNMYLVSNNTPDRQPDGRASLRVYGFKIWDGDTLVRDYRPARVDATAGLYDLIRGIFQPSDGPSQFTAGPDQSYPVTWISDGQVVKSGYYMEGDVLTPPDISKEGFTLEWTDQTGAIVDFSDYTMPGGSMTFTAVWTRILIPIETVVPVFVGLSPNPVECRGSFLISAGFRTIVVQDYTIPASAWKGAGPYYADISVQVANEEELISYVADFATLGQRVAEYNAILTAEENGTGVMRFWATSVRPAVDIPIKIITGMFTYADTETIQPDQWQGEGPWTCTIDMGHEVRTALCAMTDGMTAEEARAYIDAGIHVAGVSGNTVTLRAMLSKPTIAIKVGVLSE